VRENDDNMDVWVDAEGKEKSVELRKKFGIECVSYNMVMRCD
jgi:hypothetical protein